MTTLIVSNIINETIGPKVCTSDSDCECGYACVGGTCQELIPAIVNAPQVVQKYPFWMVYNGDTTGCSGFEGEALSACKFGSGLCNNTPFVFTVTGSVTDSNGHPICGVPLSYIGTGVGKVPWSTDTMEGYSSWSVGTTGTTDSNGEFSITITMYVVTTAFTGWTFLDPPPGNEVFPKPFSFTIGISATGYTNVQASIIFEITNTLCEQNAII